MGKKSNYVHSVGLEELCGPTETTCFKDGLDKIWSVHIVIQQSFLVRTIFFFMLFFAEQKSIVYK